MRRGWEDALDAQMLVVREIRATVTELDDGSVDPEALAADLAMSDMVRALEPMWVDPEVVELCLAAGDGFRRESLLPEDLPVARGFALLGASVPDLAIADTDDDLAAAEEEGGDVDEEWSWPCDMVLWWADEESVEIAFYADLPSAPFSYRVMRWWFGELDAELLREARNAADDHSVLLSPTEPPEVFRDGARFFQVLMRLAQQRVAVPRRTRAPRSARRRAARAGHPPSDVNVVTLRRPARRRSEGQGEAVDWSCRWLVGGHWRNQWYPSTDTHRQVFVAPYVKGPDEKPLRIARRAWEFIR